MNNILIVDDEAFNIKYLKRIIKQKTNINFLETTNGFEVINILDQNEIDLILLDINLGDNINGYEIAKKLKNNDKTKKIPIIFITGNEAEIRNIEKGYSMGCIDYLSKPVNKKVLNSKISIFLDIINKTKKLEIEMKNKKKLESILNSNLKIFKEINSSFHKNTLVTKDLDIKTFIKSKNKIESNINFFKKISNHEYIIISCDPIENGILSSIISIYFNGIISELANEKDPLYIAELLNDKIFSFNNSSSDILASRFFLRSFIAKINTQERKITYVNSNHSNNFILSINNIKFLSSNTSPLGLLNSKNIKVNELSYEKESSLYIFSSKTPIIGDKSTFKIEEYINSTISNNKNIYEDIVNKFHSNPINKEISILFTKLF